MSNDSGYRYWPYKSWKTKHLRQYEADSRAPTQVALVRLRLMKRLTKDEAMLRHIQLVEAEMKRLLADCEMWRRGDDYFWDD